MVNKQVLGLFHHFAEIRGRRDGEITFHVLDIIRRKGKHLCLLNALNAEVAPVEDSEAILLETEIAFFTTFVVNLSCHVDHNILGAEVLQDGESFHAALVLASSQINDRVDDLNELVV